MGTQLMIERLRPHRLWLLCLALAVVTLAVFSPVRNYDYIRYDDDVHVTNNPHVTSGLSWKNAEWAITTTHTGYWQPLTWLSHQADCQMFGLNPGAAHLGNLLLHIANSILLLLLLHRMTKRLWPSALVAALFALHPLHVESVAWISQRKDVLSTFFGFLALLAYARYAERPSWSRYLATLVLFALGLLSKPMLVTLPVLMLVLDYWPLDRLHRPLLVRRLLEKVPFLALAAAVAAVTFVAQRASGAMSSLESVPVAARLDNAMGSTLSYVGKMFWPSGLAVLYPHPGGAVSADQISRHAVAFLLLTGLLVFLGRRRGFPRAGWAWFLVALLPVIGIVQVGVEGRADRYTYVSLIGLFAILTFAGADFAARSRGRTFALASSALAILVGCVLVTAAQLEHWRDSASLFGHALRVTERNYVMQKSYGELLFDQGRAGEALPYFEAAMRLQPRSADIRIDYGNALRAAGRSEDAIQQYETAVALEPHSALAHYNLAVARAARRAFTSAAEHYKIAVDLEPEFERALCNLGGVLLDRDQPDEAIPYLDRALKIWPEDAVARRFLARAHLGLGVHLQEEGKLDEAAESFRRALKVDSRFQEARDRLEAIEREKSGK